MISGSAVAVRKDSWLVWAEKCFLRRGSLILADITSMTFVSSGEVGLVCFVDKSEL